MFKKGDIILVKFPFTNGKDFKLRPALIIGEYKNDFIILAISSNKNNGINYEITKNDMKVGELLVQSYIKINKITSISNNIIYSNIGKVDKKFLKKVINKFINNML